MSGGGGILPILRRRHPALPLEELPESDWSLKPSISATCCTERDELRRQILASRTSRDVRMLPVVRPRVRFRVAERVSGETPSR